MSASTMKWQPEYISLAAETLSEAERMFGSKVDGTLLERYALEAVIDLLSQPAPVIDFVPQLALRQVREAIAQIELNVA